MRVLQLVDTMTVGGAQRLQLTYARMAAAHGDEPSIISLRAFLNSPLPAQLQAVGARVRAMPGKGLRDVPRIYHLARLLHDEHIELLHAHLGYAIMIGAMAGRLAGVPVVATLHSTRPDAKPQLEALALRWGTRRVIAVGSAVAEAYKDRVRRDSMVVLPNPVSEPPLLTNAARATLRGAIAGDATRPLIVTAARLAPDNGFGDLLSAMNQVRKLCPDAVLAIAGIGRLQEELEARIAELKLADHVRLLGLRNDLPEILASADMYVSASLREGLPITILEAMAAGLPIIATRVGDVPELLKDGRGVLVEPGNPEELQRAMLRCLERPVDHRRVGAAARDYVLKQHSPEAWYEQLLGIYAEAVRKPVARA
ncbi:MAG: glycosyltransferase [Anaerolineae bacterium]